MRSAVWSGVVATALVWNAAYAQMGRGTSPQEQQKGVVPVGVAKNTLYPEVEYVSGHEGFDEKRKGQLVVTSQGVDFYSNKGTRVFGFPITILRNAEHNRDIRDPSVGKKLLFGSLAGDRKQDFVTLTTETDSTAEGVVFKVQQNVATGIAAKINFYIRKAARGAGSSDVARTASDDQQPVELAAGSGATPDDDPALPSDPPSAAAVTPPTAQGASTGERAVLQDDSTGPGLPLGTKWIVSLSQKMYYPVGCSATKTLLEGDKLYYGTEDAPKRAGFRRSIVC